MTDIVKPYKKDVITRLTRKRPGEEKIGNRVQMVTGSWLADLKMTTAKYVILGIPEDIGVRANYGRAGAGTAFKPALESFLNQQHNVFLDAATVFVLGEVFVDDLMEQANNLNVKNKYDLHRLRGLVAKIDLRVSDVVRFIVELNKIPIVIGGGHNNSFGNIKGTFDALKQKINVINCDPHLDFRLLEGRHSGNGFSYAFEQQYINKYAVVAMHEQYNNQQTLQKFREHPAELCYTTYESVFVREEFDFKTILNQCVGFLGKGLCGLEIDLDAITNVPSSAKTSSGISPMQARQYIHTVTSSLQIVYLHIAEGAPVLSHIKADNKTGKLISYLITDFIKAHQAV